MGTVPTFLGPVKSQELNANDGGIVSNAPFLRGHSFQQIMLQVDIVKKG